MVEMRSLSKFGLSQLTLIFRDGTDIFRARQLVSERLQSAREKLPPGLQPELAPITTGLGEIFLPLRIFCPPHLPVYTLRRGPQIGQETDHVENVRPW